MRLVAFDPGNTTGYAIFEYTKISEIGQKKWEEPLLDWVNDLEGDVFVIEAFLIEKARLQYWDKGIPLQVVGAIKARARKIKAKVEEQRTSVLPVAYKWMGSEYNKQNKDHHVDAAAHGNYYLVKHKLKQPGS